MKVKSIKNLTEGNIVNIAVGALLVAGAGGMYVTKGDFVIPILVTVFALGMIFEAFVIRESKVIPHDQTK